MEFEMIRYSSLLVIVSAVIMSIPAAVQKQESPPAAKGRAVAQDQDPDRVARRDYMRAKLMYSQNILEGLTRGDFKLIKTGIDEIQTITAGEQWISIDNEDYKKLTEEFKTATRRLKDAAETGNLEATALRYYQLSTSCIDCHVHIRKIGYEY
jgi:cytochrome c556